MLQVFSELKSINLNTNEVRSLPENAKIDTNTISENNDSLKHSFTPSKINKFKQPQNEQQICELKMQLEEAELRVLTKNIIIENDELGKKGKNLLKDLLEEQRNIILNNGDSTSEKLEEIKQNLSEGLDKEVIQTLLSKRINVTQLEIQLKSLQSQEQYETQPSQTKFEILLKDKEAQQQSEQQIYELKRQLEEIELK